VFDLSWQYPMRQPLLQTRDAAQQQEEAERADSIRNILRLRQFKKGFASIPKMDFMRLFNDLDLEHSKLGVPPRISIGPLDYDMFGLSNTMHPHRNA
jgi:hypothetical protein